MFPTGLYTAAAKGTAAAINTERRGDRVDNEAGSFFFLTGDDTVPLPYPPFYLLGGSSTTMEGMPSH